MLAKMKCAPVLEGDPLACRLRDALGADSARAAVLRVVDRALEFEEPRLREIVQRCDLDGSKVVAAASELHLSPRQVFRYRVAAVEAIARTVDMVLSTSVHNPRVFQLCPRCLHEMSL